MPGSLGKERKRLPRVVILAVILVAVLVLGAVAWLAVQIVNNRSEYTKHSPILIEGNGGFTNSSGVVSGSGTASDPYIIADWEIDASNGGGIWMQDTDAHFIVKNCYVHDGWPVNGGIYLQDCSNGTLENNNCPRNGDGITLGSSNNNRLINNTCSSNLHAGIYLFSSSNNTLVNNTCSLNGYWGIDLAGSSNDTLRNNVMVNDGIVINVDNVIQSDNLSYWNRYSIDTSNTVNGKPVYYYKNESGITVPAGGGEVILANCTDFIIENQNLSGGSMAIEIGFCSNGVLRNNTCSNFRYGIYLSSSSNNTLSNNKCRSIIGDRCIYLSSSSNNTLSNNNCSSESGSGINLYSSSNNTLSNNNCSNGADGIVLVSSSSNNTLSNNNCSSNIGRGIFLIYSSNNNEISRNLVLHNTEGGVYISSSSNNRIWNNTFIGNKEANDTYNGFHVQAHDDGMHNWWNSTEGYGNYWSDWTTPDAVPPLGIVDQPYNILGSASAKDNYPLTTPPIR